MSVAAVINPIVSKKTQSLQHEALLYYCSGGNLALEHRPLDTDQCPEYVDNNPPENPGSIRQPSCFAAVQHDTDIVVYGILKVLVNPKTQGGAVADNEKVPQFLVGSLTPTPNPLAPWDAKNQTSKALVLKLDNYSAIAAAVGDTNSSDSVYFMQDATTSQAGANDSGPYLTQCNLDGNAAPTFQTITNCRPKAISKLAAVYSVAIGTKVVFYQPKSGPGLGYKVEGDETEYTIPNTDCIEGTPIAAFSLDSQAAKTGGRTIFVYFVNGSKHLSRVAYHASSNKWSGTVILGSGIEIPTGSGLAAVAHEEKLHGIVYYLKNKKYVAVKDNLTKRDSDDRGDGSEDDEK